MNKIPEAKILPFRHGIKTTPYLVFYQNHQYHQFHQFHQNYQNHQYHQFAGFKYYF